MADFNLAYEKTLIAEGGYRLTDIKNDNGGQTYAGIARNLNPQWKGWSYIDKGETPPSDLVRQFYKKEFWDKLQADSITSQIIAENMYDFSVNTGVSTATKLAQIVLGTTPDGKIGPKTLEALNSVDEHMFRLSYALAKVARYRDIVQRDKTQVKFIVGWLNRTLKGLT